MLMCIAACVIWSYKWDFSSSIFLPRIETLWEKQLHTERTNAESNVLGSMAKLDKAILPHSHIFTDSCLLVFICQQFGVWVLSLYQQKDYLQFPLQSYPHSCLVTSPSLMSGPLCRSGLSWRWSATAPNHLQRSHLIGESETNGPRHPIDWPMKECPAPLFTNISYRRSRCIMYWGWVIGCSCHMQKLVLDHPARM